MANGNWYFFDYLILLASFLTRPNIRAPTIEPKLYKFEFSLSILHIIFYTMKGCKP